MSVAYCPTGVADQHGECPFNPISNTKLTQEWPWYPHLLDPLTNISSQTVVRQVSSLTLVSPCLLLSLTTEGVSTAFGPHDFLAYALILTLTHTSNGGPSTNNPPPPSRSLPPLHRPRSTPGTTRVLEVTL